MEATGNLTATRWWLHIVVEATGNPSATRWWLHISLLKYDGSYTAYCYHVAKRNPGSAKCSAYI